MTEKKTIAVFLGGRSPEHDVSIISGLQAVHAIDPSMYDVLPVYISVDGSWFIGEQLFDRKNYLPDATMINQLTHVILDLCESVVAGKGVLCAPKKGILSKQKRIMFDVALLSFHGPLGEDGQMQGVFETANIPYTGMRTLASSVFMDKAVTKRILSGLNIPLLPCKVIEKPREGLLLSSEKLAEITENLKFPCCLKPNNLGSSIGVSRVNNTEELNAVLPNILKYDTAAILEPFIDKATEYNISVRRIIERSCTSAIERPVCSEDLLDFKQKYFSRGDKLGKELPSEVSQGMLSLTRELNPNIDEVFEKNIRNWSLAAFEAVNGTGAPRIDYICNEETGEIWLNEVNPCPGSFGYYLWEAAETPTLFTQLLTDLIEEGLYLHQHSQTPKDSTPEEARLFSRR